MSKSALLVIAAASLLICGCQGSSVSAAGSSQNAVQAQNSDNSPGAVLLKDVLRRYHAMKTFSAESHWSQQTDDQPASTSTRRLQYVAPNKFRAEVILPDDKGKSTTLTAVCDGKTYIEYGQGADQALTYPVPSSIGHISGVQMGYPMFCGTILFTFFDGEGAYPDIVDVRKPVEVRDGVDAGGKKAQVIKFASTMQFGNVELVVDPETKLVQRLSYDSLPVIEKLKRQGQQAPKSSKSVEDYRNIVADGEIADSVFNTAAPSGISVKTFDALQEDLSKGLVAGEEVPDFEVKSAADGKVLKLSSLRGKVVLLDFWATWCGPCRIGLPRTETLYKEMKPKGLEVLAISAEEMDKIKPYVAAKKLKIPFYADEKKGAAIACKVEKLPTTIIIGRDGKVVESLAGLHDDSVVRDALRKAGIE